MQLTDKSTKISSNKNAVYKLGVARNNKIEINTNKYIEKFYAKVCIK